MKYWAAILDFFLAVVNVIIGVQMWNAWSIFNFVIAVFCFALGLFAIRIVQWRERLEANYEEEQRIQHVRDNWPWN